MWSSVSGALRAWLPRRSGTGPEIAEPLWQSTLAQYPFLQALPPPEQAQLRRLCQHFLRQKQFTGVHGLVITDAMALAIAAQACVLLLHWGTAQQALRWYDDFVGIIVYPGAMLARRMVVDAAGVAHSYEESLLGDAMEGGPVTLSWTAVVPVASDTLAANVVIHEFAHKLDMADGGANGCPPLPTGFMGCANAATARACWARTWQQAFDDFSEALAAHERFGQPAPWLDPYAATDPAEFFAVACEAYWVAPQAFAQAHAPLAQMLDALFQRSRP